MLGNIFNINKKNCPIMRPIYDYWLRTRFKKMTQIENLKKSNFANLGLYAMKLAKMGPP